MDNRKFTTFDTNLMEFFKGKGINYINSFNGRNGDTGYDYGFINNFNSLLNEYKNKKPILGEEGKQEKLEKMIETFLKTSKEKVRESAKEHTKSEEIKKKKDGAFRRKIELSKKKKD